MAPAAHRLLPWLAALLAACGPPEPGAPEATPRKPAPEARRVHVLPRFRPVADAPVSCQLRYYGGALLSHVEVLDVRWGTGHDATVAATIPAFLEEVTRSAYLDWLTEYDSAGRLAEDGRPGTSQGISRGRFAGTFALSPGLCPGGASCSLGDAQVSQALLEGIDAGALPPPSVGCDGEVRSLYVVQFPPGVTIDDGSGQLSCSKFCAYHGTALGPDGLPVPYAVIPALGPGTGCAVGCGSTVYRDRLTSTVSHELVEAITDRDVGLAGAALGRPVAWYAAGASCGEIADLCTTDGTIPAADGGRWAVQSLWSNALGACVVTRDAGPPVCSAGNQGYCQCAVAADGGADAGPPEPADAGPPDAGPADAGPADAGPPPLDGGHDGGVPGGGSGDGGTPRAEGPTLEPVAGGCGVAGPWPFAPFALWWLGRRSRRAQNAR